MMTARVAGVFAWFFVWAALVGPGAAQDAARSGSLAPENLMKACGDRWRAVKDVEAAGGTTWPQYLARCRAEAGSARAPAEAAPVAPAVVANERRGQPVAAQTAAQARAPVFPQKVSERHASERPQRARQKTCSEQFQANKAANANGGLRWVEKGGGYWSKCNAHLKQARA